MAGCATVQPPAVLPPESKVEISPLIMKDCGVLKDNLQKGASFADTLVMKAEDAKTFADCKETNAAKKKVIQEFLLNEKPR